MNDFLTKLKGSVGSPSSSLKDKFFPAQKQSTDALRTEIRTLVKDNSLEDINAAIDEDPDIKNKAEAKQIAKEEYSKKGKNSTADAAYDSFDDQRNKVAGSPDMKAVADTYPFTEEAKKIILENTKQEFKHTPGEYASFDEKKTGKDLISISEPDNTNTFHEMVHAWVANTDQKPDLNGFQAAFDEAKSNEPVLQTIDDILTKDKKNYPDSVAKDLPEERYCYVAEAFGAKGLQAIPENLQPFYSQLLL